MQQCLHRGYPDKYVLADAIAAKGPIILFLHDVDTIPSRWHITLHQDCGQARRSADLKTATGSAAGVCSSRLCFLPQRVMHWPASTWTAKLEQWMTKRGWAGEQCSEYRQRQLTVRAFIGGIVTLKDSALPCICLHCLRGDWQGLVGWAHPCIDASQQQEDCTPHHAFKSPLEQ